MAKNSRKRATRRDRRKAKASKWQRAGKKMGGHVGHGTSGSPGQPTHCSSKVQIVKKKRALLPHDVQRKEAMTHRPFAELHVSGEENEKSTEGPARERALAHIT